MPTQLVTRVPDDLVSNLDRLVAEGAFESRSEAVRAGLEALLDRYRRAAVGEAIIEGYRRIPQGQDDLGVGKTATRAMIAEEPW